jgi:mRNA interferase MazF
MGRGCRKGSLVKKPSYIPDRGDLIWTDFDPQAGREQAGRRPALVLSPQVYQKAAGLMICVPITSRAKGYPFEVVVTGRKINGVALADHVKNLDWRIRGAVLIERAAPAVLDEVQDHVQQLIGR